MAVAKISKCPIATRARLLHVLSKALLLDPQRKKKAEDAREEAQNLRRLLPEGRTDLGDESDEAYDLLVVIMHR